MKQEIINGKVAIINETKEESLQSFKEFLEEKGISIDEVDVEAFGIIGGETDAQLSEWVNDYVSDLASEEAEYSSQKRGVGYSYEYMNNL